ncbi:hypothetical protein TNCV_2612491 [Trichonephila clavipes]|nr:hypothetical protein TNCV_2612491 [Trichonephila clavipes]
MALSIKKFLTSKNITVMKHFPYSPDLVPCDFFLFFLQLNLAEKELIFTLVEEVQAKTKNQRKDLLKPLSFQNHYQQWQHRIQKCVNVEGNYFEGDTVMEN